MEQQNLGADFSKFIQKTHYKKIKDKLLLLNIRS